jgi:uncharacterized membrane protein YciS (DUF1049 family)
VRKESASILEAWRYEWVPGANSARLLVGKPYVSRPVWPYRVAAVAAGVAFVLTSLFGSMTLIFAVGFPVALLLLAASWLGVDVEGHSGRRRAKREITFSTVGPKSQEPVAVVVDGEPLGGATSIRVTRWIDRSRRGPPLGITYEVAIATDRKVLVLCDNAPEDLKGALAECITEAVGSTVPIVEGVRDLVPRRGLLWHALLLTIALVIPGEADVEPTRRALIAAAFVLSVSATVAVVTVGMAARAPRQLREIYGVESPPKLGATLAFRLTLAFALLTYALLCTAIASPGGPHWPAR